MQVYEVAAATAGTLAHFTRPTATAWLRDVGDRGQLSTTHSLPVDPRGRSAPLPALRSPCAATGHRRCPRGGPGVVDSRYFPCSLLQVLAVFLHLHVAHVTIRSARGLGGVLDSRAD